MRVFWSGAISFGLVNIPIKLYPATRSHDVHFNQLHRDDGGRVRYRLVCEVCGQELSRDEIVKGYEYAKQRFVTFEAEELDALDQAASKSVDILDFVDLERIDPLYFQKGYYVAPQKGAAKAYHLLRAAMERTGKVAIATFVLKSKAHLAVVRFVDQVLVIETMYYADELVATSEVPVETAHPTDRELEMAISLVDKLSVPFDVSRYPDQYRARLEEAIARKVEGKEIVTQPTPRGAEIIDLMEALQASLERSEEFQAAIPEPPRRRKRAVKGD